MKHTAQQRALQKTLERYLGITLYGLRLEKYYWKANLLEDGMSYRISDLLQMGPDIVQSMVSPGGYPKKPDPR